MGTFDLVILVDADGEYTIGVDADDATERYEDGVGPLEESGGFRVFQVKVTLPVPVMVKIDIAPEIVQLDLADKSDS